MKRIIALLPVILFFGACSHKISLLSKHQPKRVRGEAIATPRLGLVGHWEFDETDGSTARDSSSHENDGTVHGATFARGRRGGALDFHRPRAYVHVKDAPSLDLSDWTVAAWIYSRRNDTWQDIVFKGNDNADELPPGERTLEVNYLLQKPDNNRLRVGFRDKTEFGWHYQDSRDEIPTQTWCHIAGTFDQAAGEIRVYINGVLQATKSGLSLVPGQNNVRLHIGTGRESAYQVFDGLMDDVRVYDRALRPAEIRSLAELDSSKP